jgi:hypothetical protein
MIIAPHIAPISIAVLVLLSAWPLLHSVNAPHESNAMLHPERSVRRMLLQTPNTREANLNRLTNRAVRAGLDGTVGDATTGQAGTSLGFTTLPTVFAANGFFAGVSKGFNNYVAESDRSGARSAGAIDHTSISSPGFGRTTARSGTNALSLRQRARQSNSSAADGNDGGGGGSGLGGPGSGSGTTSSTSNSSSALAPPSEYSVLLAASLDYSLTGDTAVVLFEDYDVERDDGVGTLHCATHARATGTHTCCSEPNRAAQRRRMHVDVLLVGCRQHRVHAHQTQMCVNTSPHYCKVHNLTGCNGACTAADDDPYSLDYDYGQLRGQPQSARAHADSGTRVHGGVATAGGKAAAAVTADATTTRSHSTSVSALGSAAVRPNNDTFGVRPTTTPLGMPQFARFVCTAARTRTWLPPTAVLHRSTDQHDDVVWAH